ncbi:MAG TPA: hypothetical protein PK177_18175, partial [Burkholderiaceae bacterium]|nr:hypothetical protein [Burkholderiaceae bacterium]
FTLLELSTAAQPVVQADKSSLEDWQKEARKLELQGKQEQADAIRQTILKQAPVPWPVFDEARVSELLVDVFRKQVPGNKKRQQLYEIATCHDEPMLAEWLVREAKFEAARSFAQQRATLGRKSYVPYFANHFKDVLRQCEQYGIDHRLPMNQTPLMAAAAAGNVALAEALLERGADREAIDHFGCNALHWAMREAFRDAKFARGSFAALHELLAPASVDVSVGERLVRLDRHLSEYLVFQTMWALFKSRFTHRQTRPQPAFDTQTILDAWQHLPANVLKPERNRRQHLSSVLSRNEVERDYAYNRALFVRVRQGWYQFNPMLAVRSGQGDAAGWTPVCLALNLPFVAEFANDLVWERIDEYLAAAGLPKRTVPIAAEAALAREEAARRDLEMREAEARATIERPRAARRGGRPSASDTGRSASDAGRPDTPDIGRPKRDPGRPMREAERETARDVESQESEPELESSPELEAKPPPWGTPKARRFEIERIRREIERKRKERGE